MSRGMRTGEVWRAASQIARWDNVTGNLPAEGLKKNTVAVESGAEGEIRGIPSSQFRRDIC